MEVHHHPKVEKKKFTEYLLEGLMIFLAVMLGFIAENIREGISENEKARELAISLYKEVQSDSLKIEACLKFRTFKESQCTWLIRYVKDSNLNEVSDDFFPAFSTGLIQSNGYLFEPNDGILTQLRNSGALRFFKSSELQSLIGKMGVSIANIRSRNEKEYSFIEMYIRPFSIKHYDFNWYNALTHDGELSLFDALSHGKVTVPVKGKISNLPLFNRKEAENITSYYLLMLRGTHLTFYRDYQKINHELLEGLRAAYEVRE